MSLIFQKEETTLYIVDQATKGESPVPTITAANAVRTISADTTAMQLKSNPIDRGLLGGSKFPSKKWMAGKWSEGAFGVEMNGSGTAGVAPEFSPLLKTLFGSAVITAAGTVDDATATASEFDSALDMTVGQLARVTINGAFEIRKIATKIGAGPFTYSVERDFSAAPIDTAVIAAGVNFFYVPGCAEQFFYADQYLDGLRITVLDAVAESLALTITENEIIKGIFALRGITPAKSTATDPNTPVFDDTDPHVGTDCNCVVDGVLLNMKSLDVGITTRKTRAGINSSGISDLPWMSRFEASCKPMPWVEDGDQFTELFAGTLFNIEMVQGETAGNIMAMHIEDAQYDAADITEDDGDYIWETPATITGALAIAFF